MLIHHRFDVKIHFNNKEEFFIFIQIKSSCVSFVDTFI